VGKCNAYQTYSSPASPFLPPSTNRSQPNTPQSQNNPRSSIALFINGLQVTDGSVEPARKLFFR
jgi:hypothetical protein